tara:strand:+ start:296 stop:538 length:243 start_codon:yes stop_codon:yes gene_type:complete
MFELIFGWGWIVPIFILPLLFWNWDIFGGIYIIWIIFGFILLFGLYGYEIEKFVTSYVPKLIPVLFIGLIISIWIPRSRK